MSEQIDIAVDLGAVPRPLPGIVSFREFIETATPPGMLSSEMVRKLLVQESVSA